MRDWILSLGSIPGVEVEIKKNPGYSLGILLDLYRKYEGRFPATEVFRQCKEYGCVDGVDSFDVAVWTTHLELYIEAGGNPEELGRLEAWLTHDRFSSIMSDIFERDWQEWAKC